MIYDVRPIIGEDNELWLLREAKVVGASYGTNPDDRADFEQEAALKAFEVFAANPRADRPYVLRAMHNRVVSVIRKRKVRVHLNAPMPSWLGGHEGDSPEDACEDLASASPLQAAIGADDRERALAAFERLPAEQRVVLAASVSIGLAEYSRRTGTSKRYVRLVAEAARTNVRQLVGAL